MLLQYDTLFCRQAVTNSRQEVQCSILTFEHSSCLVAVSFLISDEAEGEACDCEKGRDWRLNVNVCFDSAGRRR